MCFAVAVRFEFRLGIALSHHLIVWFAAEVVYPGLKFTHYGILGDDVVIGDRKVADQYASALELLGVSISKDQSLFSSSGAFEFAKRFFIKKGSYDCTPVSLKACLLARSTTGLATIKRMYSVNLKSTLRIGGAGYRVMSRLSPLTLVDGRDSFDFSATILVSRGSPLSGGYQALIGRPYLRGDLLASGESESKTN